MIIRSSKNSNTNKLNTKEIFNTIIFHNS